MPGVLHHILFSKEVIARAKSCQKTSKTGRIIWGNRAEIDEPTFLIGSLMPDLMSKKDKLHFKVDSKIAEGFKVPELFWAKTNIKKIDIPSLRLGYYEHLYLDKVFIEEFIYPRFEFDWKNDIIKNRHLNQAYSVDEFFSPLGLYHGYSEMNQMILSECLLGDNLEYLSQIPNWPPYTEIPEFDSYRWTPWREELAYYIDNVAHTKDTVFPTKEAIKFIEAKAEFYAKVVLNDYF